MLPDSSDPLDLWWQPFPAQITAVTNSSGTYLYSWTEVEPSASTGNYSAVDGVRYGTSTVSPAREVNNRNISSPGNAVVLMRFRGMVNGQPYYEFDGAGVSALAVVPSITVQEVDGAPSYTSVSTLRANSTTGVAVTQVTAGQADLYLLAATATQAGTVNTGVQSFAGNKVFTNNITVNGDATATNVTLNGNATMASSLTKIYLNNADIEGIASNISVNSATTGKGNISAAGYVVAGNDAATTYPATVRITPSSYLPDGCLLQFNKTLVSTGLSYIGYLGDSALVGGKLGYILHHQCNTVPVESFTFYFGVYGNSDEYGIALSGSINGSTLPQYGIWDGSAFYMGKYGTLVDGSVVKGGIITTIGNTASTLTINTTNISGGSANSFLYVGSSNTLQQASLGSDLALSGGSLSINASGPVVTSLQSRSWMGF